MIRNLSRLSVSGRQSIAALRNIAGVRTLSSLLVLLFLIPNNASGTGEVLWTHFARIGAYGLSSDNADQIVQNAQRDGVFGIEVDNDIEGRYESFVDPEAKLKAIRAVAEKAHAVGNHAFVYIAGTECITANAADTPHTLAKEHPDWLQRKITGEPAISEEAPHFGLRKATRTCG